MSKVSFRDHRTYRVHLLRVLHRAGAVPPADIYDEVADGAGITDHERTTRGRFGLIYSNRIQFARQHLIDAGLMVGREDEGWKRGIWDWVFASPEKDGDQSHDLAIKPTSYAKSSADGFHMNFGIP